MCQNLESGLPALAAHREYDSDEEPRHSHGYRRPKKRRGFLEDLFD